MSPTGRTNRTARPHPHGNQSPHRTYRVRADEVGTAKRMMAGTNRLVWATTRPLGSTTALSPEIAAWTIHRPVSTARIWLMITCSREAGVSPHDESLVVTMMRFAPAAANLRNRSG